MKLSKRLFDVFWSGLGILLLLPFFLIFAVIVWLGDRGPIIYRQERIGLNGVPFHILKFRTMVVDADKRGPELTVGQDPRITRTGHWLRRCKADELPQLVNVFLGHMSLVGPRPEVERYTSLYTEEQQAVLRIMPGVTDPASLKYRHEAELLAQADDPEALYRDEVMPDKIRINIEYANRATLATDLGVIIKTVLGR